MAKEKRFTPDAGSDGNEEKNISRDFEFHPAARLTQMP